VGRVEELDALHDAFEAIGDRVMLATITGEPGSGKTALVRLFTSQLREVGVDVLWGGCTDVGGTPAFFPWIQALGDLDAEGSRGITSALASRSGEPFGAAEVVVDLLAANRAETRVVVLDDLHLADLPSIELLRFVVAASPAVPVLIVATLRAADSVDQDRGDLLAKLVTASRTIVPRNLTSGDIEVLLSRTGCPDPDGTIAREVMERSDGNALFASALVDSVKRGGPDQLARIPEGIQAAVRARLAPLDGETRSMLANAAILGPRARLEFLSDLVDSSPDRVRSAMAPAIAAGIVTENDRRFAFSHALVRDALVDSLKAADRDTAHLRAARALAADTRRSVPPSVIAQHLLDAGDLAEAADVADWADAAASAARQVGGWREAGRWAEIAADQWATAAATDREIRSLVDAVTDRVALGDGKRAVELADRLAALARQTGSASALSVSALARARVFEPMSDMDAPPLLVEALAHPDTAITPRRRADLLEALADVVGIPSIDGRRRDGDAAREAIVELEQLALQGDGYIESRLLTARMSVESGPSHFEDRAQWFRRARELVPTGASIQDRINDCYWATSLAFERGDLVAADRLLRDWEVLADRSASTFWRWRAAMARASLLYATGRLERAEQVAVAKGLMVDNLHPDMAVRVIAGIVFAVRRDQARLGEISGLADVRLGLLSIVVSLATGDEVAARRQLAGVVAEAESSGPDDLYWLCVMSILAHAADALGESERCRWVADQLDPFADQMVMWGRSYVFGGPVSEFIGRARRGAGQADLAAAAFGRAVAWADGAGAAGFGARARAGLASVLAPDDPQRVRMLEDARETATRLGMDEVVQKVAELGSTGVVRITPAVPGPDRGSVEVGLNLGGPPSGRATVRTLGRFEVIGAGTSEPARWSSRKARDALKILICRRGRAMPREELIGVLWPDADLASGRSRLSVVLSMLRNALDPERQLAADPLGADRQAVALDLDLVSVDVEVMLENASRGTALLEHDTRAAKDLLADVVGLADGGDFLAEDPYADFARPMRHSVERARDGALRALARIDSESGDDAAAVVWLTRLSEARPDDTEVCEQVVKLLRSLGRVGEADALAGTHRARLADLGVESTR